MAGPIRIHRRHNFRRRLTIPSSSFFQFLDDLQLLVAHIFLNLIRSEINPLPELVEALAFVGRGMNDPQFFATNVFEQEDGANQAESLRYPSMVKEIERRKLLGKRVSKASITKIMNVFLHCASLLH